MTPEKEPSMSKSSVRVEINLVKASSPFVSLEGAVEPEKDIYQIILISCLLGPHLCVPRPIDSIAHLLPVEHHEELSCLNWVWFWSFNGAVCSCSDIWRLQRTSHGAERAMCLVYKMIKSQNHYGLESSTKIIKSNHQPMPTIPTNHVPAAESHFYISQ